MIYHCLNNPFSNGCGSCFYILKHNGKRIIVMDATENKIRGCGKSLTDTLYMGNFGYRIKVHDLL